MITVGKIKYNELNLEEGDVLFDNWCVETNRSTKDYTYVLLVREALTNEDNSGIIKYMEFINDDVRYYDVEV